MSAEHNSPSPYQDSFDYVYVGRSVETYVLINTRNIVNIGVDASNVMFILLLVPWTSVRFPRELNSEISSG